MQHAIPVDKPIVLMMLCNLSLRNILSANMKKLDGINIFGCWFFGVASSVFRARVVEWIVLLSQYPGLETCGPLTRHFRQWPHVFVILIFQVFGDDMAVKQMNHSIGIIRIDG